MGPGQAPYTLGRQPPPGELGLGVRKSHKDTNFSEVIYCQGHGGDRVDATPRQAAEKEATGAGRRARTPAPGPRAAGGKGRRGSRGARTCSRRGAGGGGRPRGPSGRAE